MCPYAHPVTAQYCILLTFLAALVIDTGLGRGLDSFSLGCCLLAGNLTISAVLAGGATARYRREKAERQQKRQREAQKVEWAVDFNAVKFQVLIARVRRSGAVLAHVLIIHKTRVRT
jgi:hypothetical protein